MGMTEIVIKIPDVIAETENEINIVLKDIQNECRAEHVDGAFHELFECSVLPKGHGDLKDVDHYKKMQWEHPDYSLEDEPIIIEADRSEE